MSFVRTDEVSREADGNIRGVVAKKVIERVEIRVEVTFDVSEFHDPGLMEEQHGGRVVFSEGPSSGCLPVREDGDLPVVAKVLGEGDGGRYRSRGLVFEKIIPWRSPGLDVASSVGVSFPLLDDVNSTRVKAEVDVYKLQKKKEPKRAG